MEAVMLFAAAMAAILMQSPPPPAPVDRITLLPDKDGTSGALIVGTASGERRLDQAYATLAVTKSGSTEPGATDAAAVAARYGVVLAAQPPRPVSYVLYFDSGTDALAAGSPAVLDQLKADLAQRAAAEIVVIGHTDRVGTPQANDALSLKRAESVRQILQKSGFAHLEVAGRGEREPLLPTADEVAEPRNRRVEISVR